MEFLDYTLKEYINQTDSEEPTPGGGSVAALAGSLGTALAKMLAHLSLGKKKFLDAPKKEKEQFIYAAKEIDHYKYELMNGIDTDAISYKAVLQAYRSKNHQDIQVALDASANVALDLQEYSAEALSFLPKLIKLGNKTLYSDLIAAAFLLESCCEICALNVKANADLLEDEVSKVYYLAESKKFISKAKRYKNKTINEINKVLNEPKVNA